MSFILKQILVGQNQQESKFKILLKFPQRDAIGKKDTLNGGSAYYICFHYMYSNLKFETLQKNQEKKRRTNRESIDALMSFSHLQKRKRGESAK